MKTPAPKQGNRFHGERLKLKGVDGSSLLSSASSECPFTILGISRDGASEKEVLKAWRKKTKLFYWGKMGDGDDTARKVLNDAKERALQNLHDESKFSGDKTQQEDEEMIEFCEERVDLLWKIVSGQTESTSHAEQSESAKEWMDKDKFKRALYGLVHYF